MSELAYASFSTSVDLQGMNRRDGEMAWTTIERGPASDRQGGEALEALRHSDGSERERERE